MYKIVGVGKAKPGKVREAIAASKGLAEYMNSKLQNTETLTRRFS